MREKIIPYTFKITWVAGKTHYIADALFRYPVFGPAEDNFNVDTAIKCLRSLTAEPEPEKHICKAKWGIQISHDRAEKQRRFLQAAKWPPGKSIQKHPEQTQGNELMLKDNQKIVVPRGAQDEILKELHRSHSGSLKTYTTAAQLYYWPGIKNSIKQMIESCGSSRRTGQESKEQQFTCLHLQKLSHPWNTWQQIYLMQQGKSGLC